MNVSTSSMQPLYQDHNMIICEIGQNKTEPHDARTWYNSYFVVLATVAVVRNLLSNYLTSARKCLGIILAYPSNDRAFWLCKAAARIRWLQAPELHAFLFTIEHNSRSLSMQKFDISDGEGWGCTAVGGIVYLNNLEAAVSWWKVLYLVRVR